MIFETDYNTILTYIDQVDPVQYAKSRNYIDGAVTRLSPYISRGVISTKQVLAAVLQKGYKTDAIESFIKELCWRDYFQRVGQVKGLNQDIKQPQQPILNFAMPAAVLNATTGIAGIDEAIKQLYQTGYMHNHCRMYTASLVCNIAQSHWRHPAQWMYYHLLDGDWASNACSWQWVAGANSSKKYYANQENINKYTCTNQVGTYLDTSYEDIAQISIPAQLTATENFIAQTELPASAITHVDLSQPTFIYNYYNLDPLWHKDEPGNRVLLIDPSFFLDYPISKKCMEFMLALSKNINAIQVYVGSFKSFLNEYAVANVYYKEHPLNNGYTGIEEPRTGLQERLQDTTLRFLLTGKKHQNTYLPKYLKMILSKEDIEQLEQRYRTAFVNSLAGFRQAVLVGTKSAEGYTNLAIFNSLIHLGANPALFGLINRPDSVPRDTLQNIMDTKEYTLNFVSASEYKKAHQTSARYNKGVSEFEQVGFAATYKTGCPAPFVADAVVQIAMKFEERINIALNGTVLIIGSITQVSIDDKLVGSDGFISLSDAEILISQGLDAYFISQPVGRLPYAKP